MGWKQDLQVRDLESDQRLELTCRSCGHVRFVTAGELLQDRDNRTFYLDEVETKTTCIRFGCRGKVRLALIGMSDVGGFIGGIA